MIISRLLSFFATALAATLRIRWIGDSIPQRSVVIFWHGKMFAGWYCVRDRKPVALVSKSKDGAYLAAVLASWGYRLARGSSKKEGMEALQQAMENIRNGDSNTLVITPDGPRGPYHQFKRGAFIAARDLGLPLYLLSIQYKSPIQLKKSWDRFELPKPFYRVTISSRSINVSEFPEGMEEQRVWLDELARSVGN
jgi:lysophospholipid acyltransferase (LPLAT)-like uncharacterized protein